MARRSKPYFESYGRKKFMSVLSYWFLDFRLKFPSNEYRERFRRDWPVVLSAGIMRSREMKDEFLNYYRQDQGKEDLTGMVQFVLESNGYGGDVTDVFAASKHTIESVYGILNKKAEKKPDPKPAPKQVEREEDPYAVEDDDPEEDKPKSYNQKKAERLERERKAEKEQSKKAEKEFKRGPDREELYQKQISEIDLYEEVDDG